MIRVAVQSRQRSRVSENGCRRSAASARPPPSRQSDARDEHRTPLLECRLTLQKSGALPGQRRRLSRRRPTMRVRKEDSTDSGGRHAEYPDPPTRPPREVNGARHHGGEDGGSRRSVQTPCEVLPRDAEGVRPEDRHRTSPCVGRDPSSIEAPGLSAIDAEQGDDCRGGAEDAQGGTSGCPCPWHPPHVMREGFPRLSSGQHGLARMRAAAAPFPATPAAAAPAGWMAASDPHRLPMNCPAGLIGALRERDALRRRGASARPRSPAEAEASRCRARGSSGRGRRRFRPGPHGLPRR